MTAPDVLRCCRGCFSIERLLPLALALDLQTSWMTWGFVAQSGVASLWHLVKTLFVFCGV